MRLTTLKILPLSLSMLAAVMASSHAPAVASTNTCSPDARVLGYSDSLDKLVRDGVPLGGLSNLSYDKRSRSYVSSVDNHNHEADPARVWFFKGLNHPRVTRYPLVLRHTDGTIYTSDKTDLEGLGVLADGNFIVSSETEPSIRVFGRDGREVRQLEIPSRFANAPLGEAKSNETFEGLTVDDHGKRVIAGMESSLEGDRSPSGDSTFRRFLVYGREGRDNFTLTKQVGYRVDPGYRVSEVQATGDGRLVVLEAAFDPATGNKARLFVTSAIDKAPDVSEVNNLASRPQRVLSKNLVVDLLNCPDLGAPAKQTQTNSLLDNFEGFHIGPLSRSNSARLTLISDDNYSATQITRVVRLEVSLPTSN